MQVCSSFFLALLFLLLALLLLFIFIIFISSNVSTFPQVLYFSETFLHHTGHLMYDALLKGNYYHCLNLYNIEVQQYNVIHIVLQQ